MIPIPYTIIHIPERGRLALFPGKLKSGEAKVTVGMNSNRPREDGTLGTGLSISLSEALKHNRQYPEAARLLEEIQNSGIRTGDPS